MKQIMMSSFFSNKKVISKVQSLELHEATAREEVKLFPC